MQSSVLRAPSGRFASYAALLVSTALAYAPAWRGGLLWDDDAHITRPVLSGFDGLVRIWTELGATQQYYPLAHSAFWLMYQLWAENTVGYHLVNIMLHATGAFLLWLVLQRLAVPGALLAAFLFALHPLHVESVAWISELKNTLSGVLYLAAALVYLRFDETRARTSWLLAFALFIAALLTKTVTATLPAALLVVFWWRRGRLTAKNDVVPLLPWFAAGITFGLLTAWVERHFIGATGSEFDLGLADRVVLAGRVIWFYTLKLVLPLNLTFVYPRWAIDAAHAIQWLAPLAVIAVLAALWLVRPRTRSPLAVALLFAGSLFPALGFFDVFPFRYSYVADHFAYLASVPLLAGIAALLARAARTETARLSVALLVCAPLAVLTWRQSANYTSAETLYRATLQQNPGAWLAHNNLGKLLAEAGNTADAQTHLEAAVRLNPAVPEHHNNLGRLLIGIGDLERGAAHMRQVLAIEPRNADAMSNLGVALLRQGRQQQALSWFERALAIVPDHAEARLNAAAVHNEMGVTLARAGRLKEAARHFERAARYSPEDQAIRRNLEQTGVWFDL